MSDDCVTWLDPNQPHDEPRSAAQIAGLLELFPDPPARLVELGCGAGRIWRPLVEAGHIVQGLDNDQHAVAACAAAADSNPRATVTCADIRQPWPLTIERPVDGVLCLGNTFMLFADVNDAVELLQQARSSLKPDGVVVIDDLPHDFWPELTSGNWQNGISEDGSMQMIWQHDDAVFTLRLGDAVDPGHTTITSADRMYRLWTMGALRLAARLAGFSQLEHRPEAGLILLRR